MRALAHRARTVAFRFVAGRAGWTLAGVVRALARTWRYRIDGVEHLAAARREGGGILFCFWHGRMLDLAIAHADRGIGVLVSTHPDGEAAAGIIESLGYVPIRGSRLSAPIAGARAMLRFAAEGGDLGLTPDAHARSSGAFAGAVALARLSGHAIVPVAATARPRRIVDSWDLFEIPPPGAEVRIRYGVPVRVPERAGPEEREATSRALEETLREMHLALEAEGREPSVERGGARAAVTVGG